MEIQVRDGWDIGPKIKEARLAKGWSIRDAAARSGMSGQTWQNVEYGQRSMGGTLVAVNPSDTVIAAAARAVGLDVDECIALAARGRTAQGGRGKARTGRSISLEEHFMALLPALDDRDLRALMHLAEQCVAARQADKAAPKRGKW